MLLTVIALLVGLGVGVGPAWGQGQVQLTWDPPVQADGTPVPGLAGYRLAWGTSAGQYTTETEVGLVTTVTTPVLPPTTWYFAVKAYTTTGDVSPFSNEATATIAATIPVPAPGPCTCVVRFPLLPQGVLHVVRASSQDSGYEAVLAIDGKPETFWHTQWRSAAPPHPHTLTLRVPLALVDGLRYLPRQDGTLNGTITSYAIFLSQDGETWGSPVATGTWAYTPTAKVVRWPATQARYVRLVARAAGATLPYANAAEVWVFGEVAP